MSAQDAAFVPELSFASTAFRNEDERVRVVAAEVRLIARGGLPASFSVAFTFLILHVIYAPLVPADVMMWWGVCAALAAAALIAINAVFAIREPDDHEAVTLWYWLGTAGALAMDAVLAATALVLMPYAPEPLQLLTTLIIGGALLGQTLASASNPASVFPGLAIAYGAVAAHFLLSGSAYGPMIGVLALAFAIILGLAAVQLRILLRTALIAQYRNGAIAHTLAGRTEQLEETVAAAERAREAADRLREDRSRFLAAVSHDLRQPLQAAGFFVAGAAKARDTDELRRCLDGARGGLDSASQLLQHILDFIRLDAGKLSMSKKAIALRPILDEIAAEAQSAARNQTVDLRYVPTGLWVRSDPLQLTRIVRNLVINAIVHARGARVLLGARAKGDAVEIWVADDGVGIPPDEQPKIFSDFVQGREASRTRSGLGLGLPIVRRLSDLLGHQIGFHSRPNRGTLFFVRAERAEPGVTAAQQQERAGASLHVLYVEDRVDSRAAMAILLAQLGHSVAAVTTAQAAVAQARSRAPDVILADFRLGAGETGLDAVDEVRRALDRDIPAVLITGDGTPSNLQAIEMAGLPVLFKPVAPEVLNRMLSELAAPDEQAA